MTAVLNVPSQAVMRRLGLTEVARFDHPNVPAGHPSSPRCLPPDPERGKAPFGPPTLGNT
jgi:hypothetical protein